MPKRPAPKHQQYRNKLLKFKYDSNKAIQAILWLAHKHGGAIDKLKLVKLIFFADRDHLEKFGRPIVGGPYVAMKHGPVPSNLLDYIDCAVEGSGSPFKLDNPKVIALAPVNEDELSESDIQSLGHANDLFGHLDTFSLRNLTHKLKAWSKNYLRPSENTSYPLPYEDFFLDLDDDEILEIILDHQESLDF